MKLIETKTRNYRRLEQREGRKYGPVIHTRKAMKLLGVTVFVGPRQDVTE